MLKIAEFDLLKDDSYTDAILERLQKEYATEEEGVDGRCCSGIQKRHLCCF